MKQRKAFLISAGRTTVAPEGGCLKNIPVDEMASKVITAVLEKADVSKFEVDDLIISNALAGGGNLARLCALKVGLPTNIVGTSVDRQCVGGLDAIIQAAARIKLGESDLIVAGGVESHSLRPERRYKSHWNETPIHYDRVPFFPNDNPTIPLGNALVAFKEKYQITDKEEYEWVQKSHEKSIQNKAIISKEIVPMHSEDDIDSFARNITWEMFKKSKDRYGYSHPCNTAPKADAAAFVVVASEAFVKKHQPRHCVEIVDGHTVGGNPKDFPILPAQAMKELCRRNNLSWDAIEHVELMEAYATQAILCVKLSELPYAKVNPHGGAISRGHPIGASGAIVAVHLFYSLLKTQSTGVASIAGAGGLASALLLKAGKT